ncbi:MAG: hypothetical protein LBE27_07680 [Deltaproteobacteria bacterium]|nr:hypothetical protein [Deltaproteobacteria bacterium]
MVVEKYEPDIKLNEKMQKRPYLCMRFWPKDNKAEDVLNLAIVAFEETAGPEIEEEHVSYINAIYNRYFVGETKLRVHFTVIFGPNVEPF